MEKHKKLVELLLQKTNKGLLDWKKTVREDMFRVSFSDSSLQVSTSERSGVVDFVIEMVDSGGRVVDSFDDRDLDRGDEHHDAAHWFVQMQSLHQIARRTSLGSEQVLNSILSELEGDDIPF